MKRELILILACLVGISALAEPIKVAVIDTGIDPASAQAPLCPGLSYDFVRNSSEMVDLHGHGTHVSDTIDQYAKGRPRIQHKSLYAGSIKFLNPKTDYCQISLRYYDPNELGEVVQQNMTRAYEYAAKLKVDIVNVSGGGVGYPDKRERAAVEKLLNQGVIFVAASGNTGLNLDLPSNKFYPASYDKRIIVVGALDVDLRTHLGFSNYGKDVDVWELGQSVWAVLPNKSFGFMSGTSQATAITTGKLLRKMLLNKSKEKALHETK